MTSNAPKEENYYNSESKAIETHSEDIEERKETDIYVQTTCEETFGKECYDENFWEDYHKNTTKEKNNQEET